MKTATKFLISAFAVMALAVSCGESSTDTGADDSTGTDTGGGTSADPASISFSATAPEGDPFSSSSRLSVYAYDSTGTLYEATHDYSYSDDSFVSSDPIVYETATQTLGIVALCPRDTGKATLEDWTSFSVYANQNTTGAYAASNLMIAAVVAKDNNATPALAFTRLLSKVVINVSSADDSISLSSDLTGVSLTAYDSLMGSISTAGEASFSVDQTATSAITMAYESLSSGTYIYKAIVAPAGTISGSVVMAAGYEGDTSFSDGTTLEAGKLYTVDVKVKNMEVEVTSVTITDWTDYDGDDTSFDLYNE